MFHGAVPEVLVKDAPGAFLEPAWSISLEWQFYLVAPLLTNPIMRYLGRISYSLYLSHTVVIIVIQYALLTWATGLSQMAHFGVLLASTTAVTIAVSAVLYRCLEIPGIQACRSLARRLTARQAVGAQDAMFLPRETGLNPLRSGHPAP